MREPAWGWRSAKRSSNATQERFGRNPSLETVRRSFSRFQRFHRPARNPAVRLDNQNHFAPLIPHRGSELDDPIGWIRIGRSDRLNLDFRLNRVPWPDGHRPLNGIHAQAEYR